VVDPGSAPATGTPEPGGLTPRELLEAVRRITMELPVAGVDIVELSPPFDHAEVSGSVGRASGAVYDSRSTIMAMPWPPPTHIDSSPMVFPVSSRALSSVVMMRAPVWPKGWPRAMAPPRTLSLS
jgi:hypothetical protein